MAIDPDQPRDAAGKQAIAGYYTVSMSSIDVRVIPGVRRGLPAQVSTALIGRLAVDERHQRQGLGELLLSDALRRICQAAEHVAAHAIVLDSIDDDAKQFYKRYGFLGLSDDPLHLFLPLATARADSSPQSRATTTRTDASKRRGRTRDRGAAAPAALRGAVAVSRP